MNIDYKGLFVTFEGTLGAGKATQLQALHDSLEREGYEVISARHPGGTKYGENMREILTSPYTNITPETELLAVCSSLRQLFDEVVIPGLRRGAIVSLKRGPDSVIAYQSGGRGIPLNEVLNALSLSTRGFKPDLTFLLDRDVSEGLEAAKTTRKEVESRFFKEGLDFHKRVYNSFQNLALSETERFVNVVFSMDKQEETHKKVMQVVKEHIETKGIRSRFEDSNPVLK